MTDIDGKRLGWGLAVVIWLIAALAVLGSQPASMTMEPRADAPLAAAVQPALAQPEQATTSDERADGIKVHGHWTIAVLDGDGSVVDSRDFENALTLSGSQGLGLFVGRQNSVGFWAAGTQPCTFSGNPTACDIDEPAYGPSNPAQFPTLQVSVPTSGADAYRLRLTGSATAQNASSIDAVSTLVSFCPIGTASPTLAQCNSWAVFSSKTLSANTSTPPVPVQAGQQIQVTVVISFS